ncbi:MAG TPA: zf-HC2 domain-containing protein [Nitrospiraceae bacterium]|jgi:anti-sigma factor RsiW|nr:zf-HC2 domain-containing protein [Nitrospiraceae bacterium]
MTKKKTAAPKKRSRSSSHTHGQGHCLELLKQLSAYIDDELPADICREIRRHLGACPNCEVFIASLQHTVTLCRHRPAPQLTSVDRMNMRRAILDAAHAR